MADTKLKRASCMLTPEQHAAFKIACIRLGTTMDKLLENAAREAIVLASLTPAAMGKGEGDEVSKMSR